MLQVVNTDARYWDRVAETWHAEGRHALWRRHSDAVNRALVAGWLPEAPVDRLLKTDLFDEVVTDGLAAQLGRRARRVVGIDVSPVVARLAAERHPGLDARAADVRSLPFGDGDFDAVVSLSTLDHFDAAEEVEAALRELARVLRPGGNLVLTMDNLSNPVIRLRNSLPRRWLQRTGLVPYYVGVTYGPRALRAAVTRAGFEVEEMTATVHCPRVLAVAVSAWLDRVAPEAWKDAWARLLARLERLGRLPTRYVSGHFIAVRARRR